MLRSSAVRLEGSQCSILGLSEGRTTLEDLLDLCYRTLVRIPTYDPPYKCDRPNRKRCFHPHPACMHTKSFTAQSQTRQNLAPPLVCAIAIFPALRRSDFPSLFCCELTQLIQISLRETGPQTPAAAVHCSLIGLRVGAEETGAVPAARSIYEFSPPPLPVHGQSRTGRTRRGGFSKPNQSRELPQHRRCKRSFEEEEKCRRSHQCH